MENTKTTGPNIIYTLKGMVRVVKLLESVEAVTPSWKKQYASLREWPGGEEKDSLFQKLSILNCSICSYLRTLERVFHRINKYIKTLCGTI